jgi:D-alanine-D-alanine ligase
MAKHVAVLMGGWSAEREVSLRSGKACAEALIRRGYRVSSLDVTPEIAAALTAAKPDVALNVLHGRPGEDGTLQGLLDSWHSLQPFRRAGVCARHAQELRQGPV